jgi:amidohydrolase
MIGKIRELAKKYEEEIIAVRRYLHQNPETSWNEVETTKYVAEALKKLGCENIRIGFGGTSCGVTADIVGTGKPGGKLVALRADIDALPLNDEKDVPYKSQKANATHACGHDAHTAMLLGAAKILMDIKSDLKGTVRLLFQPAEEHGIRPGAKVMVEEGAMKGVSAAFGVHVMSTVPSGELWYKVGPFMAAADGWDLTIFGKGGHGSAPEVAIDPTVAAAQIINDFQCIVSREISPRDTAVVSVGGVKTSSFVFNIIPERVEMTGSIRTFRTEVQDYIEAAMKRIVEGVCSGTRCKGEFKYSRFLPATANEEKTTMLVKSVAEELFGAEKVKESPLNMGSEDFSYFGTVAPASFAFLGIACAEKKTDMPHHSPKFDVDETVLFMGSAMHAAFAWSCLEGK